MSVRKTSEGVVITTSSLRFGASAIALVGALLVGAIGAVRFLDKAKEAPSRSEFVEHVRAESSLHAEQRRHDAFQDSSFTQLGRDLRALNCYIAQYPMPLCRDESTRRVGQVTP